MVSVNRFGMNTTTPGTQDDVQLARLLDGSVVAVWRSSDGAPGFDDIRAQHFDHLGNKIGAEFIVNTAQAPGLDTSAYFQSQPDITALSDGGYVIVYLDNRATTSSPLAIRNVLVSQRFDANDQRVGEDASLVPVFKAGTTDAIYGARHADVVGLPAGGYMMTYWADPLSLADAAQDPDQGIRITGYTGGTPFSQAFGGDLFPVKTVNTLNAGSQRGAKIEGLIDLNGNLTGSSVVVWMSDTITPDGIDLGWQMKAQIVNSTGDKVGSEITIPRVARLSQGDNGERFDIASLKDGGFVVVFEQFPSSSDLQAGKQTNIFYQIYNADGSPRGVLTQILPTDATARTSPTVAAHSDGTFLIAWVDQGTVKGQLVQSSGAKIGAVFDISNPAITAASNPEAVLTGNGTYFVAWEDNGREYETGPGIVGAVVDPAGTSPGTGNGGVGLTAALVGAATHAETTDTTTYNIAIRLSGPATKAFTVFYTIEPGDVLPASSADFVGTTLPSSGQVVFGIGEQEKIVPLQIAGDAIVEGNETFKVLIFEAEPDVVTSPSVQTVTILEGPAGPQIPVLLSGGTIVEGTFLDGAGPGATNYTVTIALQSPATKTETLSWGVRVGAPSAFNATHLDFKDGVLPSGTLTFAAGESSKTINIPILADGLVEESELFYLAVSNLSSGLTVAGPGEVPILIANDDTGAAKVKLILPPGGGVLEGTSANATDMSVTLKLDKASTSVQNLDWFVKLGPGFSNVDFNDFAGLAAGVAPSGTVYFQPGETSKTVIIPIAADNIIEGSEFFTFSLTGVSAGIETPAVVDTRLYIVDDENTATPSIAQTFVQNSDVAKGLAAAYQLLLGGVPNEAGFKFLIDTAVATNFGAGAGPVFNTENIYINLVNNLAQGNPGAKTAFAALAPGATLTAKIEAIYKAIIPVANQTAEGLAFLTRPEGVAFYQAVAAERGVAGSDGAAIVAMAALIKIATDQNIGIGSSLNALVNSVFAGSDNLPAAGDVLTSLTTAIGSMTPPPEDTMDLVGIKSQTEMMAFDFT